MAYIKNAGKRSRSRGRTRYRSGSRAMSGVRPLYVSRSRSLVPLGRARSRAISAPPTPMVARKRDGSVKYTRRRNIGASNSKSAGFFKKGTSRRVPETVFATKGIVLSYERGGQVVSTGIGATAEQVNYVGHSTMPYVQVRVNMWRAFVKFFAEKCGYTITSMNDVALKDSSATAGITWVIQYRKAPGAPILTQQVSLSNVGTWEQLATGFRNSFVDSTNYVFERLECFNNINGVFIGTNYFDLTKCKLHMYCKSTLKIQNRTINTSGNIESDDVDNVPLYGKSYEGTGNGAFFLKNADSTQPFIADANSGLILPGPILTLGNFYELNEPPNFKQFQYVKKHGKAHLDPGQIKTSVLVHTANFTWSRILNEINQFYNNPGTGIEFPQKNRISIGKFRFFAMEKMIQSIETSDVNKINMAYEHDYKLGCYVTCPRMKMSLYVVDVAPK